MTVQDHPGPTADALTEAPGAGVPADVPSLEETKRPLPAGVTSRHVGLALAGLVTVIGLFAFLYAVSVHAYAPDSDGATVAVQGQAILHGNVLLNRWTLSLDSFWTVDVLWYAVAVLFYGLHPALLHAVPVLIVVAVIVVGVVMAVEKRRGTAAAAAAGTVVVILALPAQALARFLLRGPLHIGTTLWCLVAFLALRRGRFGWGFAVGVVFLAAGLLGDLQMAVLGVVPVLLAGLSAIGRTRDWRGGLPQVAAAISSLALAEVIRWIAREFGTFSIARANPTAKFPQMLHNVKQGIHEGVSMMGVGSAYFGLGADPRALSYVHLIAILVVFSAMAGTALALLWGVVRGRPSVVGASSEAAWRLDDMLFFGALGSAAAFIVLATSYNPSYGRYLTSGFIFGTILSGRVVGRVVQGVRWRTVGRVAAAVGLAATACYLAGVVINLDRPAPVSKAAALAGWLEAHDLHDGVGDYWSASIVTVESSGSVEVRPVFSPDDRRLVGYNRNSSRDWYNESFRFVVFRLGTTWGNVTWQTAIRTFGSPSRAYVVDGSYRVMVWTHSLHVPPLHRAH
jgi:hypothetical protein